jgi:hypothetical protein
MAWRPDIKIEGYKNPGVFEIDVNEEKPKQEYSYRRYRCKSCKRNFWSMFKVNCIYCHSNNIERNEDEEEW